MSDKGAHATPDARSEEGTAAEVAMKAAALAEAEVEDDQDKAGAFEGEPVDPGTRKVGIGVDVGGSGIKAAAVDLDTGEIIGLRHRVPTPQPSTPASVVASIARMIRKIVHEVTLDASIPVGVGFPAVVIEGVTKSAANVDAGWKDFDADAALERVLARPVHLVNDADAAGVAEMRFGAGAGQQGTVFLITLGTGTGSALFFNGMLVPNLELGHMEIRGRDAERRSTRDGKQLGPALSRQGDHPAVGRRRPPGCRDRDTVGGDGVCGGPLDIEHIQARLRLSRTRANHCT